MARLEVRCCCNPMQVFGSLEVPDHVANGGKYVIAYLQPSPLSAFEAWDDPVTKAEIEVKPFNIGFVQKFAVYSDDRSIEFWRTVPSFIEAVA